MKLLDDLRQEHERIERVLGALRTYSAGLRAGRGTAADLARFVAFFRTYAGAFHHEREERVLFPALTGPAALPADRGPVKVILDDHSRMAGVLDALASASDPEVIDALATRYSHELWQHIDAENSVLFPESEQQLRRNGVLELPSRDLTAEEQAAAADGDALARSYPPMTPDSIRGDGCAMCHAWGDGCRGLEREWWNDWMWEELDEHVASS